MPFQRLITSLLYLEQSTIAPVTTDSLRYSVVRSHACSHGTDLVRPRLTSVSSYLLHTFFASTPLEATDIHVPPSWVSIDGAHDFHGGYTRWLVTTASKIDCHASKIEDRCERSLSSCSIFNLRRLCHPRGQAFTFLFVCREFIMLSSYSSDQEAW